MNYKLRIMNYGARRKWAILIAAFLLLYLTPYTPYPSVAKAAGGIEVTPAVIDEKAYARDILERSITIRNAFARNARVYISVNNIDPSRGKTEFVDYQRADRTTSLANWIEISRGGIELSPGETRTIPFEIRIAPDAAGGEYHAALSIGEGSTREQAESTGLRAVTSVNIEILESIREKLDLKKFISDKVFFLKFPVSFSYVLENVGNRPLVPSGEIIIYDRRGNEVGALPVNGGAAQIEPEGEIQLASVWEGAQGMGRYKAYLQLEYGSGQRGSVTDSAFFWVIPLPFVLGIFLTFASVAGMLAWFVHAQYEKRYRQAHELVQAHMNALQRDRDEMAGAPPISSAPSIASSIAPAVTNEPLPQQTPRVRTISDIKSAKPRE
jgi:hypothetical protein